MANTVFKATALTKPVLNNNYRLNRWILNSYTGYWEQQEIIASKVIHFVKISKTEFAVTTEDCLLYIVDVFEES